MTADTGKEELDTIPDNTLQVLPEFNEMTDGIAIDLNFQERAW
jgi:hypothetical protein